MAKVYQEVFEDTQELFTQVIADALLEQYISVKVLAENSLKKIGTVVKANDLMNHETKNDVYIILNEAVFEQLEDDQKKMAAEELVAEIYFDAEKSKLTLIKPDFVSYTGFLSKFTIEKCVRLKESIKTLLSIQENGA